ncbi:MAG: VWA-like domain-containing protein [Thioalkalispiraceae bacterium]|jgi:predicted metal-dependent peptidase
MEKLDIENKLAAARTRLILDKPFLGALVLRLPMIMADPEWCKTTATDARKFYYNPEYVEQLTLSETQFILAHEALHCALSHFARREHRIKHRWDIACDYAINPLLINDGLQAPPGSLFERSYDGMTAEEIYPYIEDNENQETLDQHLYDKPDDQHRDKDQSQEPPPPQPENKDDEDKGASPQQQPDEETQGAPQPPPLSHDEQDNLSVQWQQRLAGAAQQAMQAGKLSGDMARLVDFLIQPQLPWRMLLARYMTALARDDYSYTRPSTRRGDPAIFPSLRSSQVDVVIVLDTSGSISENEMKEFISEIDAIKGQMRARIILHACDAELAEKGPWTFEPWEEFNLPGDIQGGGGTDFRPVFEWAETLDRSPDLLIYFTDAVGRFPEAAPYYPVIWLVKGKQPVRWGQRIQLN